MTAEAERRDEEVGVGDSYFTEARRVDPHAVSWEPYRGHVIREIVTFMAALTYQIDQHSLRTFGSPDGARGEVDDCLDPLSGLEYDCTFVPEGDIFDRFDRRPFIDK